MSDLKNPMRFSMRTRTVDITNYLQSTVDDDWTEKRVTEIEIRPGDGQLYVHWEEVDDV